MRITIALVALMISATFARTAHAAAPFAIEIVDDQSGRGVPLVELKTTSNVRFYTDSAGVAAIDEPSLANQKVFFTISSYGYEFPADGFGIHGTAVDVKLGDVATLKIKRTNIAERLYRITGEGIYRDTVLIGRKPPIEQPLLNAQVTGQDSVLTAIYQGKLYFFWGDTAKLSYPLGLFAMAGATADLPGKGGLDPSIGINLHYFTGKDGFARPMAPLKEKGPVWVDGISVVKDEGAGGRERMHAHYSRMESLAKRLERGLMVWNDDHQVFEKIRSIPEDTPLAPGGHPFVVRPDGEQQTSGPMDFLIFPTPFPTIRTKATWHNVNDLNTYDAFTCLKRGTRYKGAEGVELDRNARGELVFDWKPNTDPFTPAQLEELIKAGKMTREESPFRLTDVQSMKPIKLHGGSIYWNDFRRKWILIGVEFMGIQGGSPLGEIWFSEAPAPEGPWHWARKIATHSKRSDGSATGRVENMDLYNPTQHPMYDQQNGRIIYFEGTFTNSFSGNPTPVPRYEYNQLMYRLDLADERLKFP